MANIPEPAASYTPVYQLEVTDKALAGADGVMNTQAAQLMARGNYLLQRTQSASVIVRSYDEIRAYSGQNESLQLCSPKISGSFRRDPTDTTSSDNGGTTIVVTSGANAGWRFKRVFDGPVSILWWNPAMDGVTDDTSAWFSAVTHAAQAVILPPGRFRIPTAVLPSNVQVSGVKPSFNRATSQFVGGSVIVGRVLPVSNCRAASLVNLGIDGGTGGGNALEVSQTGFRDLVFEDLVLRASNHGCLIEQNGNDPSGAIEQGGNVKVVRCSTYGGPNGFAVKALNVDFIDCNAYDVTVQAFVAVSDNINGASQYSRAQNVRFINCGGNGNQCTFRVYSRDTRSLVNSNGVQAARNIQWISGSIQGCSQYGAHIGDFSSQTSQGPVGQQTLLKNEQVFVSGARVSDNGYNGILVTRAAGAEIDGNTFGSNGVDVGGVYTSKNIDYDTTGNVTDLRVGDANVYAGSALGKEQGIFTWPASAGTVNLSAGARLYKTANTTTTFISTIQGARPGEVISVLISDDFTILNPGKDWSGATVAHRGAGTMVTLLWDSVASAWIDLGERRETGAYEATATFASDITVDYRSSGATARVVAVSGNINTISAVTPNTTSATSQTRYILRLVNAGAARTITLWGAVFIFPDGNPSAISAAKTRFCEFYWDGAALVCTKTFEY